MAVDIDYIEDNIREEIKRADHMVFVTLKYTRTADVIKNVIKRLINAFDLGILELLELKRDARKIEIIPKSPIARLQLLEAIFKSDVKEYVKLYNLFKKIDKGEYAKRDEYRKGVTLIVKDKKPIEVNMVVLKGYFEKTKDFIKLIEEIKIK